jgi:hypothetical protein
MWREFGIATNVEREHGDGNVGAFQALDIVTTYVPATDGDLRRIWPARLPADARIDDRPSI